MRDANDRGNASYDQTSEQKIVSRDAVRQALWNKHLQSPALALTEALRRVEGKEEAGSLTSGGSRKWTLLGCSRRLLNVELVGDWEVGTKR